MTTDAELRRIVMDCDRCHDPHDHDHFTSRPFVWCWPKLTVLHPATPTFGFRLNRYPHNVIGVAFYWRRRGLGLRWKGSRR